MERWGERLQRGVFRVRHWLRRQRKGLWFYPMVSITLGFLLYVVTSLLDESVDRFVEMTSLFTEILRFGGQSSAARSLLSSTVGGWATLMGMAFSIMLVVLKLATNKFASRLVPPFEQDRITQLTLASYTGLVTCALLVLKMVRTGGASGEAFVPVIGANVAILCAVASLVLTVWFIAHLSDTLQPLTLVPAAIIELERELDLDLSVGLGGAPRLPCPTVRKVARAVEPLPDRRGQRSFPSPAVLAF